jgi:hypothetical protein
VADTSGSQVTVTSSVTQLSGTGIASVLVRNRGSVAVYLGDGSVSSSNGFQIDPGEAVSVDLAQYAGGLYGRTASSTARVDVLQVNR